MHFAVHSRMSGGMTLRSQNAPGLQREIPLKGHRWRQRQIGHDAVMPGGISAPYCSPRVRRRQRCRNGKREYATDDQKKAHVHPPSQFLLIITLRI
jgi:hypothetical protein